ncbi:flagellar basal body rod protein FlgB [Asticcacaulis sp. AND118]|uniref:flagellar basal body rod protein FlgB n=1 Tax=Asticcacaulis sp. AND118 TaxID=2840468 RepID=UPI001CFF610F|nr:flagellar basal body rod protein FlgB [Asticcacaulis sp. AND118]UDF02716.1 flagellar basal body rod protein FlgB [Asticcacaulis sp. AND118]
MSTENIGLLGALKDKMTWLGQRQKLVAQNVANATTPGFKPRDLKRMDFEAVMKGQQEQTGLGMRLTEAGHMSAEGTGTFAPKSMIAPDSETTMDGNSVVLEEQMLKMAESRMQYEAALGFYQKTMGLIRMAGKAPGR